MNLPNILTTSRIIISLTVPFFMFMDDFWVRVAVGIICAVAGATDWFDGWYARKYNLVSKTGKILDPIADKVYIIMTFSVLASLGMFSIWWVIPIFIREIVITIYRFIFLNLGKAVAAVQSGKIKMAFQVGSIGLIFLGYMYKTYYFGYYPQWLQYVISLSLLATIALTLYSGYVFFQNNWKLIKSYHTKRLT